MMLKISGLFFICATLITAVAAENVSDLVTMENEIPPGECETKNLHRAFENEITQVLECIRQRILKGIPTLRISTLDPLKLPIIPLWLNNKYVKSRMFLTKFQLDGLAGFEQTKGSLDINFLPPRGILNVGLMFKNIRVTSNYRGNMKLFQMIYLFGRGNFRLDFNDFEINARVEVAARPLKIKVFSLEITLPTTTAKVTGLFRDEYMSDIISRQFSDTFTMLAEEENARVNRLLNTTISSLIIPRINDILEEVKVENIIKIITSVELDCQPAVAAIVQTINKALVDVIGIDIDSIPLDNYDEYIDRMLENQ